MIYEFTSRATAPVMMLERDAEQILRILGKAPDAEGIIQDGDVPQAIDRLRAAVALEQATRVPAELDPPERDADAEAEEPVSLRQRAWPLIDMLARSHDEGHEVVWSRRAA